MDRNKIARQEVKELAKQRLDEDIQRRRALLNYIAEIDLREKEIDWLERKVIQRKAMAATGTISEKDQWGNTKSKEDMDIDIRGAETQVRLKRKDLLFVKEDLFYLIKDEPNLKEMFMKIDEHYDLVRKKEEEIKNVVLKKQS